MSKHTPGPWESMKHPQGTFIQVGPFPAITEVDTYVQIARLGNLFEKDFIKPGLQEDRTEEIKANARLISQAPELLKQLENLVKAVHADQDDHDYGWIPLETAMEEARELIEQIKGEL
jgi:hypothetical protein